MLPAELRAFLLESGLTQAQFARLVDVTPRAVTQWLAGARAVPGPVGAYLRVFRAASPSARQLELQRLQESKPTMRDGMYAVQYQSRGPGGVGYGYATIVLDSGKVFGADPAGGKYDGEYLYDETVGMAQVRLKVTMPPNVQAVFGPIHPYEWSIDITGTLDPTVETGYTEFRTPLGPTIEAQYQFLRGLPES
jgi:Helix-turn-helix